VICYLAIVSIKTKIPPIGGIFHALFKATI